jgi:hypothetical protein
MERALFRLINSIRALQERFTVLWHNRLECIREFSTMPNTRTLFPCESACGTPTDSGPLLPDYDKLFPVLPQLEELGILSHN